MSTATTPTAEPAKGIVGTTISGRYHIERLLGEGGMGAVYAAEHTLMHKRVAVKVLHAEMSKMDEVVARFEREAMAAAHIEHPNVANATDFGKLDDGSFFLVLEFVEGKSLREAIAQGPFAIGRAVHVARQIASALSRAHGLGIVHRDLKPENVMLVTRDADPDFVKVLDFGIAKVPVGEIAPKSNAGERALTQLGMVYGTPEYMPPEQALGQEVDRRADLYSLGVILYEMLVGRRPFDDESKVKLLGKHITAPVPPLPSELGLPPELAALVMRLLAKEASERVQEARDAIDAFDQLVTPPPGIVSSPRVSLAGVSGPQLPIVTGTNPTVFALRAHAQSLASDVTKTFSPRVLAIAGAVVGALVLVAVIALGVHAASSTDVATDGGVAVVPHKRDAHFDRELKKAQGELGAAQYDVAIAHAQTLAAEQPTRGEPYHIMFRAHLAKGDAKSALADATQWLALDPGARSDPQLRDAIHDAIVSKQEDAAAFALLESGKMGAQGGDLLYDLAYGSSTAGQSRAKKALEREDVTRNASPALQVALELRASKGCEAKKELLDRAATQGDARALAILDGYAAKGGCGFLGMKDCYACMHDDGSLSRATDKLRARVSP
ncbi:MAG TPA: serine/threonine-protein kinase [Polyangiaceae bacterium]|jgi:serine/threonine-protein kinase